MIVFPNAKINLGLFITGKRPDGFHNLESIFIPIGLKDILEVIVHPDPVASSTEISLSGIDPECPPSENLVMNAYELLKEEIDLPVVKIALHKQIPAGAGLGGGSSDAAFMIFLLNRLFKLNLPRQKVMSYLEKLGSDCPFFAENRISYVRGRGEHVFPVKNHPGRMFLVVVVPRLHIQTAEVFKLVQPAKPEYTLPELIKKPVELWKDSVRNDFEKILFPEIPELAEIRDKLYSLGAVYSSLSGTGSAIFGLFRDAFDPKPYFSGLFTWKEWLFDE